MTENLEQLREIAQNAAALETEHGYTLPYVEAMRLMYGHLRASTVLALIERAEAAEAAVQRVREKHFPDENGDCDFCVNYYCDTRKAEYPCPTIRTLDGGEQE